MCLAVRVTGRVGVLLEAKVEVAEALLGALTVGVVMVVVVVVRVRVVLGEMDRGQERLFAPAPTPGEQGGLLVARIVKLAQLFGQRAEEFEVGRRHVGAAGGAMQIQVERGAQRS